jgi:hypothetical protein
MGTTKQLVRADWKDFFDQFTKEHLGDDTPEAATVEVLSPARGDQVEVSAARLLGLEYEPKSNAFRVLLQDVDHLIFHPTEIWILEGEHGSMAIEVVRADGAKEIIYVRRHEPLAPHDESSAANH